MNDADCAELCVRDFDSAHIWDVTAATVFFGLSSRVANVASMWAEAGALFGGAVVEGRVGFI
jgi:hypothetical protein